MKRSLAFVLTLVSFVLPLPSVGHSASPEDMICRRPRRYRLLRRRRRRPVGKLPKPSRLRVNIKIKTFVVRQKVDKKNLRLSVLKRLAKIQGCYRNIIELAKSNAQRQKKKGSSKTKGADKEYKDKTEVVRATIVLNGMGRATKTQIQAPKGTGLNRCFLWFLQGRKFFPPEANRSLKMKLVFTVETSYPPLTNQDRLNAIRRWLLINRKKRRR